MDGLIEIRGDEPRPVAAGLAATALALLVGTALVDTLFPAPEVVPMGLERAEMLRLERERRWDDGTYATSIERKLRRRSRVRQTLAPPWVAALLVHAGVGDRDVVVGRRGWLFLRKRAEIDERTAADAPVIAARALAAIERRFAAHGVELCALPIPRKAVVCREELPAGFDPRAAVDRDVLRAIDGAGVQWIDMAVGWDALPSEERFLRYDTHWATGAQEALAAQIAGRFPAQRIAPGAVATERTREPQDAALLRYLGIDPDGAAAARIGIPTIERVRLARAPERARTAPPEVALIGSSFTATFDLHALVSGALGRDVEKLAVAGSAFSDPLVRLVASRRAAGQELPELVLFEFPMHQVLELPSFPRAPAAALAQLFLRLESPTFSGLGAAREACSWEPGEVPSSGDGVLQVELEIRCDRASRWELASSGMKLAWKLDAGSHRMVLPVVDGPGGSRGLRLVALDEGARAASTNARLGLDVDLSAARPWTDGTPVPVAAHDVLLVRWSGAAGDVRITASGTTAAGETVSTTHAFVDPTAELAALSLPELAGGSLRSVRVTGGQRRGARVASLPVR